MDNLPTCPICHLPAHAAESDDFDRHPTCAARFDIASFALYFALVDANITPTVVGFRPR